MSFLLLFGDKLIPYHRQSSKVERMLNEYNNPTTTQTAFIKAAVDRTAKSLASNLSSRLTAKGGFPELEDPGKPNDKSNKPKPGGNKNGRRNGNRRNGSGNGKAKATGASESVTENSKTRGYQEQEGTMCILFNSGVSSGLTVNTRVTNQDYTPLYLSSGYLFKITDVNVNVNTQFIVQLENIVFPLIASVISNTINRYAIKYFTVKDYSAYMVALIEALQVYYCIDNVLTYGSNITRDNINVGMEHIRSTFTAEAIDGFKLLRETICTCSCPPNLINYIRFMCQSYRTSDAPHSSIIKLNIGGMFDEEWNSPSTKILDMVSTCRQKLIDTNILVNYLNQGFPEWEVRTLPPSASVACYDKNFLTFWHNQNCCYLSTNSNNKGNFEYSIDVPNLDSYTDYQIIQRDTEVDGVIFVSQTYNIPLEDNKNFNSFWGIWHPLASLKDKTIQPGRPFDTFNIKCYQLDNQIKSVTDFTTLGCSGIYNLVSYSGNTGSFEARRTKFGTHGFVKLQNVSVRMQTEAFSETMRYLFLK